MTAPPRPDTRGGAQFPGQDHMSIITGLHHVTVNSGDPQENIDFYVGVLGLRLVKRSVNQDAPDTYHLFFADGAGSPGTELTFFPWRDLPRGQDGTGMTSEVALAVPAASLDYWESRLTAAGVANIGRATRFGEPLLTLRDPHGLALALVGIAEPREFVPCADSAVPEAHQIRGLHAIRMAEARLEATEQFLVTGLGFAKVGEEQGWHRYVVAGGGSGRIVDVHVPAGASRGFVGTGSVHHVAFRVDDDAAELAARQQVRAAGAQPTPVIDRYWFKSVYFREPGGALFEIATDGPGFTVDEDVSSLGERLVLPPFLEPHRAEIERGLQPVTVPGARAPTAA